MRGYLTSHFILKMIDFVYILGHSLWSCIACYAETDCFN